MTLPKEDSSITSFPQEGTQERELDEVVQVVAKPDIESSPSESKKAKLLHLDGPVDDDGDQQMDGVEQDEASEGSSHTHGLRSADAAATSQLQAQQQPEPVITIQAATPTTTDTNFEHDARQTQSLSQAQIPTQAQDTANDNTIGVLSDSSSSISSSGDDEATEDVDDEKDEKDPQHTVQAVPLAEELETKEEWWELKMTWAGKTFELKVGGNDMVYDFRHLIAQRTGVPVEGQKLIGLLPTSKSKLGVEHDSKRFGTLGVKKGGKFTMVGTREEERFKDRAGFGNEVVDDFDVTYSSKAANKPTMVTPAEDPRNKRKIREIIERVPITVMNEPREGKKLLVLDLDYTIVDTKPLISGALPSEECARPGLHEFLEKVYPHYDIVIWSQTHWRWLEAKLAELGMIGGTRDYKVSFVSDRTTMFPVFTQRDGKPYKHEVKPLAYFWATFPQWSAKNTIHIDDLARNFALNPGEGLRIRAFNKAGQPDGLADRELWRLGSYLVNIATGCEDFTSLDHARWKHTVPRQ